MPPFWSSKSTRKSKAKKSDSGSHSGDSIPKSPTIPGPTSLRAQFPTYASSATKIRLSILSTALVDALGAPAEFHKRFKFPFVNTMQPNDNFNLPPGVWTDDTSMMLCLATSISSKKGSDPRQRGEFDEVHQLELYRQWNRDGYLSAVGKCFDVGNQIKRALNIFNAYSSEEALHRIRSELGGESFCGNGSLMRIIPIGLAYWSDEALAKQYARRSSQATHPSTMCVELCEMWTGLIGVIMEAMNVSPRPADDDDDDDTRLSKLTLLEFISRYPYTHHMLQEALTLPFGVPPRPEGRTDREHWYHRHHPLLRLINDTQVSHSNLDVKFPYAIPPADRLPSTGYALHTAIAALYCFFTTKNFEDGALLAVNLGDDADTVGAVYAGLAGCWYGGDEGKAEEVFWTKRVREWKKALVKQNIVEEVAERLVVLEKDQSAQYM